ncbi:MAG: phosphodiester glycosidase family protein [Cyanobacteria bacterium J06554_1]
MQRANKHPFLGKLLLAPGLAFSLSQCAAQPVFEPVQVLEPVLVDQIPLSQVQPTFAVKNWPNDNDVVARVHIVTIPPNYPVDVAVGDGLKTVKDFATETQALAVINGGFFDPNNAQTTSFVTVNGTLAADPRNNARLIDNPDLAVYREQILNRSEFRRYDCVDGIRYDITVHKATIPHSCTLHSALGAGPQLLPNDTSQVEGFTDYGNGTLTRDAIGSQQRNARSAIGIKEDNTLLWVMAAQSNSAGGMTLAELAEFMATMNTQKVLNLDGGSSSSLYVLWADKDELNRTYYGRLDQNGQKIQRPVKSVFLIPKPIDR